MKVSSLLFAMSAIFLLSISMGVSGQSNPYRNVNWATLPDGRTWGAVGDLDVAPDGEGL